jgi:hypothetical protein
VYHLESNGGVESANDIIFKGIKKNLTWMSRGNGPKSYLELYVLTTQLLPEPQTSHHSNCCTKKKQPYPKTSSWGHWEQINIHKRRHKFSN